MRGDVVELPSLGDALGHEQRGRRYAVVVQSDDALLSTLVVAPTSTRARAGLLRPEVAVRGQRTSVMIDQLRAVDPQRLGRRVGGLTSAEMLEVNAALRRLLALDLPW